MCLLVREGGGLKTLVFVVVFQDLWVSLSA